MKLNKTYFFCVGPVQARPMHAGRAGSIKGQNLRPSQNFGSRRAGLLISSRARAGPESTTHIFSTNLGNLSYFQFCGSISTTTSTIDHIINYVINYS
jgi:hypothetical protein